MSSSQTPPPSPTRTPPPSPTRAPPPPCHSPLCVLSRNFNKSVTSCLRLCEGESEERKILYNEKSNYFISEAKFVSLRDHRN